MIASLVKVPRLLHPFAFALAPVLHMGAVNILEVDLREMLAPCVVVLVATAVLLGGLWLLLRDYLRCAAITSLLLVIFFSYGHAVDVLWEFGLFESPSWLYAAVGIAAFSILLIAGSKLWRTPRNLESLSTALCVASLVFLAPPLWTLLSLKQLEAPKRLFDDTPRNVPRIEPVAAESPDLPDIYYIVADEYARADVLSEFFDHDNSEFLDQLRERGFYIADQSFSNYALTFLSLASSHDMQYQNNRVKQHIKKAKHSRRDFFQVIQNSRSARFLRDRGYRYVTLSSGWIGTMGSPIADVEYRYAPILGGEFRSALVRSTLLRPFSPSVAGRHLYIFDKLKEIPRLDGPTFTFAHIVLPHFPYVFDRDGTVRRDLAPNLHFYGDFKRRMGGWGDESLYVDQLVYLNTRLIEVIDAILAASPHPPIIIVQGDHGTAASDSDDGAGPLPRERLGILNAYLVPDRVRALLYPNITPVNSFRLIFSTLFGADYPPLPDRNIFSWYEREFSLRDVTREVSKP